MTYLGTAKVLLQHNNGRSHTSLKTREVIASLEWTMGNQCPILT